MTVHQDYEIKINLNELIEKRIPCCDLLHPDHCLTEKQVSEIAHDIRMDLNLHDLYKQVDQHIMNYVNAAGIDNKDHWVCLLYTSPSPRDRQKSRMPSSA